MFICLIVVLDEKTNSSISISECFWWRKPEYLDKTTNLPQVADKRYHKMLYRVQPACVGFEVIGTDFIGS
jgi:hypothetical protein